MDQDLNIGSASQPHVCYMGGGTLGIQIPLPGPSMRLLASSRYLPSGCWTPELYCVHLEHAGYQGAMGQWPIPCQLYFNKTLIG